MRECLDEAMLQGYFDGELSTRAMESATLHLASCLTCAAAARELEQESLLLSQAFEAEFDAVVPTERLRRKIDAAVAGLHVVHPVARQSGLAAFFGSFGSLFNFSSQRTLGYASLALVLAVAGIFGVLKLRTPETPVASTKQQPTIPDSPKPDNKVVAVNSEVQSPSSEVNSQTVPTVKRQKAPRSATPKPAPVKLIPGERSYLQTIARLDSTIKSQSAMRPALQVEYERNLAVVDRAIAATRSAAKSNPDNPDAAEFMFAAYQSKVDLLNTIADARLGGRSH